MRDCFIPTRVRNSCDKNARYRSISGACNNLKNREWGAAGIELVRMIPPDYEVNILVHSYFIAQDMLSTFCLFGLMSFGPFSVTMTLFILTCTVALRLTN